jgi:hypothetical protein
MTPPAVRSTTWGGCALNGKHRDPKMADEYPVLRAQRRSARAKGAAGLAGAPRIVLQAFRRVEDRTPHAYGTPEVSK